MKLESDLVYKVIRYMTENVTSIFIEEDHFSKCGLHLNR